MPTLPDDLLPAWERARLIKEKIGELEEALEEALRPIRELPTGQYYTDSGDKAFKSYTGRRFDISTATAALTPEQLEQVSVRVPNAGLAKEALSEEDYRRCQAENRKVTVELS